MRSPRVLSFFAGGGLPNLVPKLVFSFLYVNGRTFFVFFPLAHFGSLWKFGRVHDRYDVTTVTKVMTVYDVTTLRVFLVLTNFLYFFIFFIDFF